MRLGNLVGRLLGWWVDGKSGLGSGWVVISGCLGWQTAGLGLESSMERWVRQSELRRGGWFEWWVAWLADCRGGFGELDGHIIIIVIIISIIIIIIIFTGSRVLMAAQLSQNPVLGRHTGVCLTHI